MGVTYQAIDLTLGHAVALEVTMQVARALTAADAQGLVHRDLKPANLMLVDGPELTVKVIDFGLVKFTAMDSTERRDSTTHGFVGTPGFASPEQLEGQTEDVRSDLYSLGVTLWYMLMGSPPFTGSVANVISQHLLQQPPFESLATVPADVVAVLRAMLEKDKAERIQTPSQLREALRPCAERLRAAEWAPAAPIHLEAVPHTKPPPSRGNAAEPKIRSLARAPAFCSPAVGLRFSPLTLSLDLTPSGRGFPRRPPLCPARRNHQRQTFSTACR